MEKKILLSALIFITHIFSGCTQNKPALKSQYTLKPEMVINETGCGYGTNIADEQGSDKPETFWNGHDKELCRQFQPSVIINLLQKVSVTDVHIFSREDAEAIISAGAKKSANQPSKLKKGWNKIQVNASTNFIHIILIKGSVLSEVLVDASQKYSPPQSKTAKQRKILFNEFIGTNAFVDVPLGLLEPFGCIREYHDWPDWNEPQKDSFHLAVSKQGFDFENFYQNLNKAGKIVIPTLQKSPQWLTGESNPNHKPLAKGADGLNPASYSRHALFLNKYTSNFSQESKGNVQYFENWNEPDKWWESPNSYFTPYQYASMSSADKDGHQLKMGTGKGMSSGGKSKLVMAGMANPKIDYLHALKHWCDVNRKGDFPWDVINYHRYSNSSGLPDNQPKEGICPEIGNVYHEALEIIKFRNQFLPEVEVWMTEFGYDTEDSPQQCKPIGEKSSELVQGDWLIRSYLLLSAAGVEKAFQFMIRDFAKSGLYATSGLYSTTLREKPFVRPAWNYINTLKCALQDCYFEKLTVDSSSKILTAVYANKNYPEMKTKVIWLGTQDGGTKEYQIKENEQFTMISFSAGKPCGDKTILSNNRLKITETPVIIQSQKNSNTKPCYSLYAVNTSEIQCKFSDGSPAFTLTDEQKNANSYVFGLNSPIPVSTWKTDYNNKAGNGIVFYLNSLKNVHSLQIFDGAGSGEIEISAKSGNEWVAYSRMSMNLYNKWRTVIINAETKEIKVEKLKGGPDIGEIIIYEKGNY